MILPTDITPDVVNGLQTVLASRRKMRGWIAYLKEQQPERAEQIEAAHDQLNQLIDSVELDCNMTLGELLAAVEYRDTIRN